MAQGNEVQRIKEKNVELRRQQEKTSRELAVAKQQLELTRNQLHTAELARCTTQQYAHTVELRLEQNGKGPATVKAVKLQSDVEFLEKENSVLFADLQAKIHETERLQQELCKQRKIVDQTADSLGLRSVVLDELFDLRAQVISLADAVAEKEDLLKRHATDKQDVHVFRDHCSTLASRTAELEARAEKAEAQCVELLDFIEEKQGLEQELMSERDGATSKANELSAELSQAQQVTQELQAVLLRTQAERKAMQEELSGKRLDKADARRHITELQVRLAASQKQLTFIEKELRVLLQSLQEVLDCKTQAGDLGSQMARASQQVLQTLSGNSPGASVSEVVALCTQVSQNLKLVLTGHAELQRAVDHNTHLAHQNAKLWDQLSTLEPQYQHARALVAELQGQVSASAANWRQLVQSLISHFDPTSSHACIAGREYEAASAVVAHITRVSNAWDRSQECVVQLESQVLALRKELTECQDDLSVARKNCALRPLPEEYEVAMQQQHVATIQMLELKERTSAAESQARLVSDQLDEIKKHLQAREQQMKALQEAIAEQEQELLALRTFRASVLMQKGTGRGGADTPLHLPVYSSTHSWGMAPSSSTAPSSQSPLYAASMSSPSMHPWQPLPPMYYPTKPATTQQQAPPVDHVKFSHNHAPLPYQTVHGAAMKGWRPGRKHTAAVAPTKLSSSDDDNDLAGGTKRRSRQEQTLGHAPSDKLLPTQPLPSSDVHAINKHRATGNRSPNKPSHAQPQARRKRASSSSDDDGIQASSKHRTALQRSIGKPSHLQPQALHKRASSSDDDEVLPSSKQRAAAPVHRSTGKPPHMQPQADQARKQQAATTPTSPGAPQAHLQHTSDDDNVGASNKKRAALPHQRSPRKAPHMQPNASKRTSSSDDNIAQCGSKQGAAPMHTSPDKPSLMQPHSRKLASSSSDDDVTGMSSRQKAATALPHPRLLGKPTCMQQIHHKRASSSDDDKIMHGSRQRPAATFHNSPRKLPHMQLTTCKQTSSDDDEGVIGARSEHRAGALPHHRPPSKISHVQPQSRIRASLSSDDDVVQAGSQHEIAAHVHKSPRKPHHKQQHVHERRRASSSDDDDEDVLNHKQIAAPLQRSPGKPSFMQQHHKRISSSSDGVETGPGTKQGAAAQPRQRSPVCQRVRAAQGKKSVRLDQKMKERESTRSSSGSSRL